MLHTINASVRLTNNTTSQLMNIYILLRNKTYLRKNIHRCCRRYSTVRGFFRPFQASPTFGSIWGTARVNALQLSYCILHLLQQIYQTQGLSEVTKWNNKIRKWMNIWHSIKYCVSIIFFLLLQFLGMNITVYVRFSLVFKPMNNL